MHKQQNKHGPGAEAGTCIAWLLRPEAVREPVQAAGLRADGSPPPLRAVPHEKEWPPGNTMVQQRRRRRRCLPEKDCLARHQGEGPPGDAIRLIINHIDSTARSRLPARRCAEHVEAGHLYHGVIKADFGLMLLLCPEETIERDEGRRRRDEGRKKGTRDAQGGTRDAEGGTRDEKKGRGTLKEGRGTSSGGRAGVVERGWSSGGGRAKPRPAETNISRTRRQGDGGTRRKKQGRAVVVERGWSSEAETSRDQHK